MRKRLLLLVLSMVMLGFGATMVGAEKDHPKPKFQEVELSEKQTKELKTMYEDLVNQRKGIVEKYKEFGVLSEEDATKMEEHLDMFMEKMQEDGFVPKWQEHKKKDSQD
ncbi:DUF2680 domain-containing protein [Paraliobacillus sediminis]|uniref:DUF2680 domain-containing protein n=1 Tax=Paraliobacillus sediminis TaxID=1885916 RepID=UPI001F07DF40|nr:DUF2680 domain-containing protein [Paraliobacillus sediminis]